MRKVTERCSIKKGNEEGKIFMDFFFFSFHSFFIIVYCFLGLETHSLVIYMSFQWNLNKLISCDATVKSDQTWEIYVGEFFLCRPYFFILKEVNLGIWTTFKVVNSADFTEYVFLYVLMCFFQLILWFWFFKKCNIFIIFIVPMIYQVFICFWNTLYYLVL